MKLTIFSPTNQSRKNGNNIKNISNYYMLVYRSFSRFSTAKDTCLKNLHILNQGKIVEFAGSSILMKVTTCPFSTQGKV